MKAPSPLLGFNNNFKHKGSVYHIQTEDSGIKHPHIITHLFADGGRILKSIKTSYASVMGEANMADVVRAMMKEQHKAMIVALRDGQFDPGGAREVKLPTTGPFAHATGAGGATRASATKDAKDAREAKAGGTTQPDGAPIAASIVPTESVPQPVVVTPPPPPPLPSAPPSPAIDVAALERAASAASTKSPIFHPQSDLPPPPANVLGGVRPHGEYHHQGQPATRSKSMRPPGASKSSTPERRSIPPPNVGSGPSRPPSVPGRYAATRPASIFATNKPAQGSIFGEDMISERSLDEVILSYLAEDLEGEKK